MKNLFLTRLSRGAWIVSAFLLSQLISCGGPAGNLLELYVGTYTAEDSRGIYRLMFDSTDGTFSAPELVGEIDNPSYIAFDPSANLLYAVSEGETEPTSALNAFVVGEDGRLSLLSRHATNGAAPCYVKVAGDYVLTANYLGGSITIFPIAEDGSTGEAIIEKEFDREEKMPHLHGVFDAPNGELYATDLGSDQLYRFVVEESDGELRYQQTADHHFEKGFGPRHLAVSESGAHIYVLGELSGEVAVLQDKGVEFDCVQTIPSDSVGGGGCADIHLSPDGRFLYASNRLKEDGISTFSVAENGLLSKIDYTHTGIHPRNFTITPDGRWLLCANRDSDNIQIFERDLQTGLLTNTGREVRLSMPVCLVWREAE